MQQEKTITFKGIELVVKFDYQPEEKPVYNYGDGSGYPGCKEEYTIEDIIHNDESILELFDHNLFDIEITNLLKD